MTDRKQTLIIDTGERIGAGEDRAEQTNLNFISSDGIDTAENPLIDFNVKLSQPLTISKTCNIFIDHITLSGARPALFTTYNGFPSWGIIPNSNNEVGSTPASDINFIIRSDATDTHNVLTTTYPVQDDTEKIATLCPTEGPVLQLKIIGITTSRGMEHNPYVNATNPKRIDLNKTFLFPNTNNHIIKGYRSSGFNTNLNVHTYTDTTFNYVSTIKATPQNPVKIKSIRFNLAYKWPNSSSQPGRTFSVFNVEDGNGVAAEEAASGKNRAIIEFLFDPI
jgi:hypothetical protein